VSAVLRVCPAPIMFRGGLVFETHRRLHHSTLGLRVIKKKREAPIRKRCGWLAKRRGCTGGGLSLTHKHTHTHTHTYTDTQTHGHTQESRGVCVDITHPRTCAAREAEAFWKWPDSRASSADTSPSMFLIACR